MKIELTKETRKDGKVWYFIYIDGSVMIDNCFTDESESRQRFKYLIQNAVPEETKEVLEVFETEKILQS